jgi:hypothetical protein
MMNKGIIGDFNCVEYQWQYYLKNAQAATSALNPTFTV